MKLSDLSARKLDALIHVKVFKGDFTRICGGTPDKDGCCPWCFQIVRSDRPHAILVKVPAYSRDEACIKDIIEYFRDVTIHYMQPGTNRYTSNKYMAVINKLYRGIAPTINQALCIAALATEGIEIEV